MSGGSNEQRTGVFLCTCNDTISVTIDMKELNARCKEMEGVVHVETVDFLCHRRSREHLSDTIKKGKLDRVVVGACSPLLYLKEFEEASTKSGLMPSMVEMANIREQCSWIQSERKDATKNAKDVVARAVAKLSLA